jgi:hypothetical protein
VKAPAVYGFPFCYRKTAKNLTTNRLLVSSELLTINVESVNNSDEKTP